MVSLASSSPTLLAVAVVALLGNVAHAVEILAPDWIIPDTLSPYPPMAVNVGDSLTFAWSRGVHDVWIYPSGTCDNANAIPVGSVDDNPTTYTFGEELAGTTITFACDVGAHCQAGMIMDVTVMGSAVEEIVEETAEEPIVDTPVVEEPVVEEPVVEEPVVEEPVIEEPVVEEPAAEEPAAEEPADLVTGPETVVDEIEEVVTGPYGPCYVCGTEDAAVGAPENIVTLPGGPGSPPFQVDCATLVVDGLNGLIPEPSCPLIQDRADVPCACARESFTCNICGEEDFIVRAPDVVVTLPGDPANPRTCAEFSALGASGELSPSQCSGLGVFGFVPCQCSPSNFTCSICGEGFITANPETEITIPGYETSTCGELETSGFAGLLPPAQCIATEQRNNVANTCNCIPEDGYPECYVCDEGLVPLTPDVNINLSPFESYSCQFVYEAGLNGELAPAACPVAQTEAALNCNCAPADYSCDVCGGDGTNVTMLYPEVNFTVPFNGAFVNCGLLDEAGIDGAITPTDCQAISPVVQSFCGCSPTGFTCNICGEDSGLTVSETNATFIPGEEITCAEAQAAGFAGDIDPTRCAAISPFALVACGCQEGGTMAPTVTPTLAPTVKEIVPATEAPENTTTADEIDTTATDTDTTDESTSETTDKTAVAEEDPADLVTDSGTAIGLEGSDSKSESGSAALSFKATLAISSFMGFFVALLL